MLIIRLKSIGLAVFLDGSIDGSATFLDGSIDGSAAFLKHPPSKGVREATMSTGVGRSSGSSLYICMTYDL